MDGHSRKVTLCLSDPVRLSGPLHVTAPSRSSSNGPCAAPKSHARDEEPPMSSGIPLQVRCCGKAHLCRILPLSSATAPSKLHRSTRKLTLFLCGASLSPGRWCNHVSGRGRVVSAVRRACGFQLDALGRHLQSFAAYSDARHKHYVCSETAI